MATLIQNKFISPDNRVWTIRYEEVVEVAEPGSAPHVVKTENHEVPFFHLGSVQMFWVVETEGERHQFKDLDGVEDFMRELWSK